MTDFDRKIDIYVKGTAVWSDARQRQVESAISLRLTRPRVSVWTSLARPFLTLVLAAGIVAGVVTGAKHGGRFLDRGSAGTHSVPPPAFDDRPLTTASDVLGVRAPIRLPLEVLGPVGTERELRLPVGEGVASAAHAIRLKVHGLRHASMATLSVDHGPAVALSNSHVVLDDLSQRFEGIGGPLGTLGFTLPLSVPLSAGELNLRFRFAATDNQSIGFRVLEIQIVTATGAALLPPGTFAEDDPRSWRAPFADAESRLAGQLLWQESNLTAPPPDGAGPRRPLFAHCMDCHARDGRDLQYFAYSNLAIIERSRYYGLSHEQGLQIASYIRSLPLAPMGRPWNPPYQPGPGLDVAPAKRWAAGAGLHAVMAHDEDALPFIFPDGAGAEAFSPTANINLREHPISFPLPDWNRWLPPVHPRDGWGADFAGSQMFRLYGELRTRLSQLPIAGAPLSSEMEWLWIRWSDAWHTDFKMPSAQKHWTLATATAHFSLSQWFLVKNWELMTEFDLEQPAPSPGREARAWVGKWVRVTPDFHWSKLSFGTPLGARYFASAWGHLGIVLNPGLREHKGRGPIPWWQVVAETGELADLTGQGEPTRLLAYMTRALQQAHAGIGNPFWRRAWSLELADPVRLVAPKTESVWKGVSVERRAEIATAFVTAFLDASDGFDPQDYQRGSGDGLAEPADQKARPGFEGQGAAGRFLAAIPRFEEIGVDPLVVQRLRTWASSLWPATDWGPSAPP